MMSVFDACYTEYASNCSKEKFLSVKKEKCAATVVAGTKTMWGGNHFTAMVKPPGLDWEHIDPTRIGGPQRTNRSQCGGYSSMIEAETLIHYLKTPLSKVDKNKINMGFFTKLRLMFNTWFAGHRLKSTKPTDAKGTSYAEMADFSASRIEKLFAKPSTQSNFLKPPANSSNEVGQTDSSAHRNSPT